MDIKTARQSFHDVTYGDAFYKRLLSHLEDFLNQKTYHLCLLIGEAKKAKKRALTQVAEKSGLELLSVDANDIIIQNEEECKQNIDSLFENFNPEKQLLHVKNGSRFSGVYIGNTLSKVKYATPQERYFLKKVKENGGLFVIEIDETDDAERTIRRAAQSIVNFPPPRSGLKKMIWNLKQVSLQGSHLKNDRPKKYAVDGDR
jgi:hypothetical protein